MARKRRRSRKKNPSGMETTLLTTLGVIVGGVGGFVVASWGCGKLLGTMAEDMQSQLPGGQV